MKLLYLDLMAGIAGDMTLAALVDLGASKEAVKAAIDGVVLDQVDCTFESVKVDGITALQASVTLRPDARPQPRHYSDIVAAIDKADLDPPVKDRAQRIFAAIAEAESTVHGVALESVHFHEVGAWDSIADIVGVSAALHDLGVERMESRPVPLGRGFVRTQHGGMPVPAPATLEILKGIPVVGTEVAAELTTPTGAGIVRALAQRVGVFPSMTPERVGWGAGHRRLEDRPNLVRAVLGSAAAQPSLETLNLLEANIDDQSGEELGATLERLMELGALDVWFVPLTMKKSRPGVMLSVLCRREDTEVFRRTFYRETTTFGIRESEVRRSLLDRTIETVSSSLGTLRVKVGQLEGEIVSRSLEFEDVRRISREKEMPLKDVMRKLTGELLRD